MKVQFEIDEQKTADEVNEIALEEIESAESIRRWIEDNQEALPELMRTAIAGRLTEDLD